MQQPRRRTLSSRDHDWRNWIAKSKRIAAQEVTGAAPRLWDDDRWRHCLRHLQAGGVWTGPCAPPGEPGCPVPVPLLREFDLHDAAAFAERLQQPLTADEKQQRAAELAALKARRANGAEPPPAAAVSTAGADRPGAEDRA